MEALAISLVATCFVFLHQQANFDPWKPLPQSKAWLNKRIEGFYIIVFGHSDQSAFPLLPC
jgi:hypothetical protein